MHTNRRPRVLPSPRPSSLVAYAQVVLERVCEVVALCARNLLVSQARPGCRGARGCAAGQGQVLRPDGVGLAGPRQRASRRRSGWAGCGRALVHSGSHSTGRGAQLLRHLRSDAQASCSSRRPAQVGKQLSKKVVQRLPETTGRQGLLPHMHVSPVARALRSRALLAWERQGCASHPATCCAMPLHPPAVPLRSVPLAPALAPQDPDLAAKRARLQRSLANLTEAWKELRAIPAVATCGPR